MVVPLIFLVEACASNVSKTSAAFDRLGTTGAWLDYVSLYSWECKLIYLRRLHQSGTWSIFSLQPGTFYQICYCLIIESFFRYFSTCHFYDLPDRCLLAPNVCISIRYPQGCWSMFHFKNSLVRYSCIAMTFVQLLIEIIPRMAST